MGSVPAWGPQHAPALCPPDRVRGTAMLAERFPAGAPAHAKRPLVRSVFEQDRALMRLPGPQPGKAQATPRCTTTQPTTSVRAAGFWYTGCFRSPAGVYHMRDTGIVRSSGPRHAISKWLAPWACCATRRFQQGGFKGMPRISSHRGAWLSPSSIKSTRWSPIAPPDSLRVEAEIGRPERPLPGAMQTARQYIRAIQTPNPGRYFSQEEATLLRLHG